MVNKVQTFKGGHTAVGAAAVREGGGGIVSFPENFSVYIHKCEYRAKCRPQPISGGGGTAAAVNLSSLNQRSALCARSGHREHVPDRTREGRFLLGRKVFQHKEEKVW